MNRRLFLARSTALWGLLPRGTWGQVEKVREGVESTPQPFPSRGIRRDKIKITDVTVTPLSYVDPKRNLWRTDRYIVWKTDAALCRIYTDRGIVGIGEGTPYAGPDKIQKYTEEMIKPVLIGQNPFDVDFIASGVYLPQQSTGPGSPDTTGRVANAAWAGVNNACWDIIGKALNQPVFRLLAKDNKPERRIRIYASGGDYHEWYDKGEQTLIEEALKYKQQGFTAFKFRSGTDWRFSKMTLRTYMPVMMRLREAVGPDMQLMHETLRSQPVTLEEVVQEFCPLLEELKFHWFEQPLRSMEEYLAVKKALKTVLVSGGESDQNRFEIKPWIDSNALDIIQCDSNVTGLSENWHIARMAEIRGKVLCPHNWHGGLTTIANAHLVAAIPNRHMLEQNQTYNPLKEAIFKDPLLVKNGHMELTEKAGYGMELIPDVEKQFPFVPGSYSRPNPLMDKTA